MTPLIDSFNRRFLYLRLSVTDACNFRCSYCLPEGYACADRGFLTLAEIRRLLATFAGLGLQKVRITGGEPTLRRDIVEITQAAAQTSGLRKIAMTTNGYRLKRLARPLYDAGLRGLNVSVDSLRPEVFQRITGHDKLGDVLAGIEAAAQAGFDTVKVNTVLLKGVNDGELPGFLDWIRHRPFSVRFIELMQTHDNRAFFLQHHLSADHMRRYLTDTGWTERLREPDAGPAGEFVHPEYQGRVGLIAPYSKDFCAGCNRLRVSARGHLHLCLFGDAHYPLRPLLQHDDQKEKLEKTIKDTLQLKKVSHFLHEGNFGATSHLASIGG